MGGNYYESLAELFEFPGADFAARVRMLVDALRQDDRYSDAALGLQHFLEAIPPTTLELQELHTRTFDVQALTTLDLGYVLFGDDYKRGELLANLSREHAAVKNDCRGELADHLPNLLRLVPKLTDPELRDELATEIIIPALVRILGEFDSARIEEKNATYLRHYRTLIAAPGGDRTAYRWALAAALRVVVEDFGAAHLMSRLTDGQLPPHGTDFLRLIEREMVIEERADPADNGRDA